MGKVHATRRHLLVESRSGLVAIGLVAGVWALSGSTPADASSISPPTAETALANTSILGTFVPYWQSEDLEPGGCVEPVTSGYALSGPIDQAQIGCAWNRSGTVKGVWLHGGSSVSYTFTVPSGATDEVTYGIPAGDYRNNADATVSVDGGTPATLTKDEGGFGSTASANRTLWKSAALTAGSHMVTIISLGDAVNLYGLWMTT